MSEQIRGIRNLAVVALIIAVGWLSTGTAASQDGGTPVASPSASQAVSPVASPVGQTFLVTSAADAGPGSLRQAILDANALPGPDTIEFDISGAEGMVTIVLQSLLPPVAGPVTIDGTTQSGYSRTRGPVVNLSGSNLPKTCGGAESGLYRDFPGLDLIRLADEDASGTIVRGLALTGFCQAISISASVAEPQAGCESTDELITGIVIEANLFRQNHGGNAALDLCGVEESILRDNRFQNNGDHIEITRSRDVLVTNNETFAAGDSSIELISSHEITVQRNRLHGDPAAGGDRSGIVLAFGSADSRILDNEISGMATAGLFLGDTSEVQGNSITGSGWYGIDVLGGSGNQIVGNRVYGNALGGIVVHPGALNFLDECTVENETPSNCGVVAPLFEGAALNNVIRGNLISDNGGPGVLIGGVYTDSEGSQQIAAGNTAIANMFSGNAGLAIDLSDQTGSLFFPVIEPYVGAYGEVIVALPDGPTPNDDSMLANGGQNAPSLQWEAPSQGESPGDLLVEGELQSLPGMRYLIEVYACEAEPVAQLGQGGTLLTTLIVQTDTAGRADFQFAVQDAPVAGDAVVLDCLTATATALSGLEDIPGATSEFGAMARNEFG